MGSKRTRRKPRQSVQPEVIEDTPSEPLHAPEERSVDWRWVGGLTVIALFVRMIALGRADLWGDEILFATRSSPPQTPGGVLQMTWDQLLVVTHLPLPRIIQNLFLWVFYSEGSNIASNAFLQRIPAVIWGVLTVPVFGALSFRVLRRRTAIISTAIMALSLFPVFFSREAYYYAPLMFFSTSSLALLAGLLETRQLSRGKFALLLLSNIGMVSSHLTGNLTLLLLLLTMLAELMRVAKREGRENIPVELKRAAVLCGLPYLVVVPFLHKLVTNPSQLRFPPGFSMDKILYDLAGKFFLGNTAVLNVLGVLVLVVGVVGLWRERERLLIRRYLLLIGIAGTLVLAYSAWKTQYAPRYFSSLIAVYVLLIVVGMEGIASLVARTVKPLKGREVELFTGIACVFLALHTFLFLPLYYPLKAKGTNYGGVAEWLNENLSQGQPYLVESAYQLRFISQYFPTPGLVAAAPFVHRSKEDHAKLRASHRAFIQQFPESPWIETARHGQRPGEPLGAWTWPHRHFRQRVDIENRPLKRMSDLGVWIQQYGSRAHDNTLSTPIWYNTDEDIEAIMRETGQPLRMIYPNWNCAQLQQGVYGRVSPSYPPTMTVKNLTGSPLKGRFLISAALLAPAQEFETSFEFNGKTFLSTKQWGGRLWKIDSAEVEVPEGSAAMTWKVNEQQVGAINGMVIFDIAFTPDGE